MGLVYLRGVATLNITPEKCTGCGICVEVCPHTVLSIDGNKVSIVGRDFCIECGACAINCLFDAISLGRTGAGCAKALIKGIGRKKELTCSKSPITPQRNRASQGRL